MENNIPDKFSFKIEGIELLEYSLKAPQTILPDNLEYKFEIGIEHKISIELSKIFVICSIAIHCESENTQFAHAKISCIYDLPDVDKFMDKENNKIQLPEIIGVTLNSISISTSRGVMFTLLRGTFLHNVILPIVDPKTLALTESK